MSVENVEAYVALGVDVLIPKPFDVHLLRAAIRRRGQARGIEGEPPALPAAEVCKLLRLGLSEPDANPRPDTAHDESNDE